MNSGATSQRPAELAPLTSFRFFAAMAIVAFHTLARGDDFLRSGVTFFYVLSGFILVYVHPRIEGRTAMLSFWAGRFGRIWPLHFVTLLVAWAFFRGGDPRLFALNLLLLQAWVPVQHIIFSFNGVAWSLSVEMFFYFLFPFLLPPATRAPALTLLAALAFTLVVEGAAARLLAHPAAASLSFSDFVIYHPLMNLYKFVFGMILAIGWRASQPPPRAAVWTWIEAAAFFGVALAVPASDRLADVILPGGLHPVAQRQLQDFLCVPLFGALIFIFAWQRGGVARLLSQRWLVFLGDISFSIYMLQWMFLLFHAQVHRLSATWGIYVAALIGLSALSCFFIEKPARRAILRLANRGLHRVQTTGVH